MGEGFVETKSLKSNYIMRNLPGIKDEPFMGLQKIICSGSNFS